MLAAAIGLARRRLDLWAMPKCMDRCLSRAGVALGECWRRMEDKRMPTLRCHRHNWNLRLHEGSQEARLTSTHFTLPSLPITIVSQEIA